MTDRKDPLDDLAGLIEDTVGDREAWDSVDWDEFDRKAWSRSSRDDYTDSRESTIPGVSELAALIRFVLAIAEAVNENVPPELRKQLQRLLRELLITARDVVDWSLERVDGEDGGGTDQGRPDGSNGDRANRETGSTKTRPPKHQTDEGDE